MRLNFMPVASTRKRKGRVYARQCAKFKTPPLFGSRTLPLYSWSHGQQVTPSHEKGTYTGARAPEGLGPISERECLETNLRSGALEKNSRQRQTSAMTNKEIVQDLLRRIPDDASLQDIARELEFIAAVRQGLSELDRGDSVPVEEVEQELPSWIIK